MTSRIDMFVQMSRHLHGPSWRWETARRAATDGLSASLVEADERIAQAAEYIRLTGQGEGGKFLAAREYPEIQAAVAAWHNSKSQPQLKIMVLAGSRQADIAARVGLDETAISTLESLFYDVRAPGAAASWVASEVIAREERTGDTDLATRLRLAYYGGPLMAQAILDAAERLPSTEADRLFDQSIMIHMKAQEAMAIPLHNEKNVLAFLRLFVDYRCRTDRLELDREKFRHRCEQDLQRRKKTEQQTEAAIDREATGSAIGEKGPTKAA